MQSGPKPKLRPCPAQLPIAAGLGIGLLSKVNVI